MSDTIVLPVPERLFAHLVVVAPQQLPRGLAEFAAHRSGHITPLVDLHPVVDVVDTSTPLMSTLVHVLTCSGCGGSVSPEMADRLHDADHFVDIRCAAGPTWPPLHLWTAAFTAETHAIATDGMPVDPDMMLPLVDDWLAYAFADPQDFPAADWIRIVALDDEDVLKLVTLGMTRLGLPELQIGGLSEPLCGSWANILNGLAYTLIVDQWADLEREPGRAFREIGRLKEVTVSDIESSLQTEHHHPPGAAELGLAVDLGAQLDGQTYLSVVPPNDDPVDANRWKKEVASRLALRRPT
jgi:hypothetical protein